MIDKFIAIFSQTMREALDMEKVNKISTAYLDKKISEEKALEEFKKLSPKLKTALGLSALSEIASIIIKINNIIKEKEQSKKKTTKKVEKKKK